ncbi:MAG: site-2 protease family protein [Clostridia bacterium]|nr:site-2 protease family protein [Clostridia bacterium]
MIGTILTIVKTLILLGVLVVIHEGGHFIAAKLCKIKVNEFSIGFGKLLCSKQTKETKYSLRLIPLGGFVNMEGEDEHSDEEGSFSNANFLKKLLIVSAGPIVNIVFGLLIYFILVLINYNFQTALSATFDFFGAFIESIKMLFTGAVTAEDLSGPVGIGVIVSQAVNISQFVYLLSVISLSLGLTNLIPIPPLDGGKLLIYIIELIKRKPLKEETSLRIQMLGFVFIIGLSIFVMFNDISRVFFK